MTHEQFAALVQRLEPFAQKNPAAYKVRLGLLAALGYAYLLAIVVVAIGLVWGLVAFSIAGHRVNGSVVKLVIFLAALVFMVLRAMWVRLTPPEGYALTRAQVPQLFGLIDELTQQLNALPVHHVILTDEFNAAVTQVPRFGLFGWPQSYLILGLPLLQACRRSSLRRSWPMNLVTCRGITVAFRPGFTECGEPGAIFWTS
jgi:hypothetical protein